jgi:hypothetical protein
MIREGLIVVQDEFPLPGGIAQNIYVGKMSTGELWLIWRDAYSGLCPKRVKLSNNDVLANTILVVHLGDAGDSFETPPPGGSLSFSCTTFHTDPAITTGYAMGPVRLNHYANIWVNGGAGNDWIGCNMPDMECSGGAGDDYLESQVGGVQLHGDDGNDTLRSYATTSNTRLYGDNGNDCLEVYSIPVPLHADGFQYDCGNGTDWSTMTRGDRCEAQIDHCYP